MRKIKRAIIIAAGEGVRLRPVTKKVPKPLVEVNGTRMIDTEIRALKRNGIHEIYIVAGYKKELFAEAYKDDPDITILENKYYLDGNNITSLYVARQYLQDAFVLEGDLNISNEEILNPEFEKSCYFVTYMDKTPEWAIWLQDGNICNYKIDGGEKCCRLWGVSMWTSEDGKKLARLIEEQFEQTKDWSIYWDELALTHSLKEYNLGIRGIDHSDIIEIDTFEELTQIDPSYKDYKKD